MRGALRLRELVRNPSPNTAKQERAMMVADLIPGTESSGQPVPWSFLFADCRERVARRVFARKSHDPQGGIRHEREQSNGHKGTR